MFRKRYFYVVPGRWSQSYKFSVHLALVLGDCISIKTAISNYYRIRKCSEWGDLSSPDFF